MDEYWLVDPRRREVTILTRDGDSFGAPRLFRAGGLMSRVVAGVDLSIEELFADLD